MTQSRYYASFTEPSVHHLVYKSLPLDLIQREMDPFHSFLTYLSSILHYTYIQVEISKVVYSFQVFQLLISYEFLASLMRTTIFAHPKSTNNKLIYYSIFPSSYYFLNVRLKYYSHYTTLKRCQATYILPLMWQISYTYKITFNIIDSFFFNIYPYKYYKERRNILN